MAPPRTLPPAGIPRRLTLCLGLSQLICWGISWYLIGVLGAPIAADFGWSDTLVHGGFSVALAVMGLSSAWIGRLIDRHGGGRVMAAGSLLLALGCAGLALCRDIPGYLAAWAVLGLAMRLSLYEAAFAALARIGGTGARRAISQVTLLGGLASSAFWPVGHALADNLGWRGAAFAYAGFALLTLPLHLAIPRTRFDPKPVPGTAPPPPPLARGPGEFRLAAFLYMSSVTLVAFLNSGMSAHMIGLMTGLGLGAGTAVLVSTLRGIGQSGARLAEVLFGARLSPLTLGLLASLLLPLGFLAGLFSGASLLAAAVFALGYGAGNGLLTIARGTQPLVLFDPAGYGSLVGRLAAPGFFASAAAPMAFAATAEAGGPAAALLLAVALGAVALACAGLLWWRFRRPRD